MPSKANTQRAAVKKAPGNTGNSEFITGGHGFGARPQLSSQKKTKAEGAKPAVTQRGPPSSSSTFSKVPDVPIKKGYGKGPQITEVADTGSMR